MAAEYLDERRRRPSSTSFDCSSSVPPEAITPMGTPLHKVLNRISGLAHSWRWKKKAAPPHGRRIFRGDVEQEDEFHYKTHCLSSYYSVFVARLAIMVMLAILIGLLTILTWHFTKVYTTKSLNTLAYGLRYELLQRPILRMWNILNSTVEITNAQVKLSEYVIRRYSKPTSQAEQVELYEMMRDMTWALFASRKALNAITINYRNGFVQAFHRDHRSNNTYYIYSNITNYSISSTAPSSDKTSPLPSAPSLHGWNNQSMHGNMSAVWFREPLDPSTGDKIGKSTPILPDDLINIAGISQVPDGTASWHVAVSKYSDSPLLSAALPVWDSGNQSIVAVVGVTTALYSVGQLMRELVEFHSGHIYLTSQEGYLLATSTNTPLLKNTTSKGRPKLIMAVDSQDRVIRSGAEWLNQTYGNNYPPSHEVHVENAKLDDQHYYIDSFFLNLKRLPLVGVIIIPRRYIMGKVDERALKTLIILISASLCILVTGCLCIFILTNGVSKEMKLRAELISHLDARRRAEASSNYKSQFLANMSHELRTPMAAVIGLLDILICDDCLNNEQYATVTQIRKCSNALLRLLNNILDLSKVESGKLVLEETEFDLGRELEGLVDMFSVQRINNNVETILDLSDDMPKLVRGDSARVVQIFANLVSNSIKFTTSGHIIIRGWSEKIQCLVDDARPHIDHQKKSICPLRIKLQKQHYNRSRKVSKKDNRVVLWFEVDDTGCGIDPSKWESVFESFEQADPSTTRLHGGTGLGLCIVRTLVNKMGGEIKVVKKNGPGTLMKLYLLLNTPTDGVELRYHEEFAKLDILVLLALHGNIGRTIMSDWLRKNGVSTSEASDWNGLTESLQERAEWSNIHKVENGILLIVVDIGLLDLSTDIWREQINFLDKYNNGKTKFAWMLNHDTANSVKVELRRKGHAVMVNKPLYKAKMVHVLEMVVKENKKNKPCDQLQIRKNEFAKQSDDDDDDDEMHECLEIESTVHFDAATSSSDDFDGAAETTTNSHHNYSFSPENHQATPKSLAQDRGNEKRSLEGLRILLAEDTPVLQRVATIMLEKLGAKVVAVGDGLQTVNALNSTHDQQQGGNKPPYDLILMDCQMPKMDGYEATKEIRKQERRSGLHIPIVALTAHAMSSDEAKCLQVGMDAYLTKPINYKLMVSTILSLTKQLPTPT